METDDKAIDGTVNPLTRLELLIREMARLGYEIVDIEKAKAEIVRLDGIIEIRRR